MKKLIVVLCLSFLPAQSFAEDTKRDNFYGSISGLVVVVEDSTIKVDGVDAGELELDTGLGLAVALGKKFGNDFRGEIEYTHRRNEHADMEDIYAHTYTAMFNLVYDIENDSSITPYLGGGLGIGWLEGADGSEFAYQFLAGVGYDVTESVDLIIGYRYAGMTDADWDVGTMKYSASIDTHNFELGVRFAF